MPDRDGNDEHSLLRRYADYFRRAEEAGGMAQQAKDETARRSLLIVAEGWRKLAEQVKAALATLKRHKQDR